MWKRTFEPFTALPMTLAAICSAVGPPSLIGFQSMLSMSHRKAFV
jgi:lipopolysaccharide export LptBFGC system permease protein LptF